MESPSDIALITGGSRGIGAAIATRLAEAGFDIWLNYRRNHEAAEEVAKRVRECGRTCRLIPFDVSRREDVDAALEPLLEEAVPAVLVNNAGHTADTLLPLMGDEEWQGVLDVHLGGFFYVTRAVVGLMMRRRRGRIVNIVSASGQAGMAGQVNYSAAKAGLIGATKALAREVAARGILVNAVAPGLVETDMVQEIDLEEFVKLVPLGRMGTCREVAGAVAFLCSEEAGYITGHVLNVNGGVYM
ncbi:MAG: 3-oxoacyl-ACP reductase FabG [Lentisphaeria bacterium]|nr:3-oxoacyl-ACP reductase FabG [Lentisphaeria bacterium]